MSDTPTGYELSKQWFDFAFEHPEKIRPVHTAIYFFAIEHYNRLGWKEKFGFPSQMVMEAIGVKNWRTYISAFNDLVEWGFFELIEKSKNQYSSNIIAIVKNTEAPTKALSKALQKHSQKQSRSTVSIDKQRTKNLEPNNEEPDAPVGAPPDEAVEVSEYLLKAIKESDPTHKYHKSKPSLKSWGKDIDRAMRIDGRGKNDLLHLIQMIFYENNSVSNFWRANIQSGKKLREKFDVIKNQLKSRNSHENNRRQTRGDRRVDELKKLQKHW